MTVQDALHFEQLMNTRQIVSVYRFGGAAIEDCCVYSSQDSYKGDGISITTMYQGDRGFLFVEQATENAKVIIGIINLEDIAKPCEITPLTEDFDMVYLRFGAYDSHYSFRVKKALSLTTERYSREAGITPAYEKEREAQIA